jgi:GT2 family glycosyltransferase
MTPPDVSVLIVNWKSGAMTRALIANLRRQRFVGRDGGVGTLEFIVTDNASGPDEEQHLLALEAEADVTLVRSGQNGGYATGMNLAAERATGDWVLVSNPDVMAFRGALAALLEYMRSHPGCGLAGPKGFLDSQRFFQLPPVELPSIWNLLRETMARRFATCGQSVARARSRKAIEVWTATVPMQLSQISGFAFLMPTALALEMGPFDGRFPFYFEDADLCRRLHSRNFSTDFVPRAQMVHFFNRSAGQDQSAAMSRYGVSRRHYFGSSFGALAPLGTLVYGALNALGHGDGHHFSEVEHLGESDRVPVIDVPGNGAYLAEISADPGFTFAAGRLDVSRRFVMPDEVWDGLVPATYYLRFLERRSMNVLRTISLTKVSASVPITAELAAAGSPHA